MKHLPVILILCCVGLVVFVGYRGVEQLSKNAFEERLALEIADIYQQGSIRPLEIQDVTDFAWDKMYIFGPFVTPNHIERTIGFEWPPAAKIASRSRDSLHLLVFVKGNQVVEYVEFQRTQGDFLNASRPEGFTPQEAVFKIDTRLSLTAIESD